MPELLGPSIEPRSVFQRAMNFSVPSFALPLQPTDGTHWRSFLHYGAPMNALLPPIYRARLNGNTCSHGAHVITPQATLRRIFGFALPALDAAWNCLLKLDELMAQSPQPDPHLMQAFTHPASAHVLDQSLEIFSLLGPLSNEPSLRCTHEFKIRGVERLARRCIEDMLSIGFSRAQACSLLAHSHFRGVSRHLDSVFMEGKITPLAQICSLASPFALNLSCNTICAELLVGTWGTWLYTEATQWQPAKDFTFASHWIGPILFLEPRAHDNIPLIGQWARRELAAAERLWDFSPEADTPSYLYMARLSQLMNLSDMIHEQLGLALPHDYAQLRSWSQAALLTYDTLKVQEPSGLEASRRARMSL